MLVLGIDAAWTTKKPSGVALVSCQGQSVKLLALARSYDDFIQGVSIVWTSSAKGSAIDLDAICRRMVHINSSPLQIIAADIPLAYTPIIGRRVSDDAVSRAYGAKWASVHTPTPVRPGALSTQFVQQAHYLGFPLATSGNQGPGPKLIEVYPHAAIIEMMQLPKRLQYKVEKRHNYWKKSDPTLSSNQKWTRVLENMDLLYDALCSRIDEINLLLDRPSQMASSHGIGVSKSVEDMLDAIVCAWVGGCFLNGQITAYGDANSTIWVP